MAPGPDGVFFGGGWVNNGERYWAPVQPIGANDVVDDIDTKAVMDDMVPCDGGVCWPDATSGTVKRYEACGVGAP